ncbi:MAG TPA: hypothetical protein VME67_11625 [Mycobacterium sp.]|nr:hypothetical protein [Mycobacterium sp.]HTX95435.1 hypothetical protein [Mycobacterium sp.]
MIRELLRRGEGDLGFNRPARNGFFIAEKSSPLSVYLSMTCTQRRLYQ